MKREWTKLLYSYVPSRSVVTVLCLSEMQYQQHGFPWVTCLTKHSYTVILVQLPMKCITRPKWSSLLRRKRIHFHKANGHTCQIFQCSSSVDNGIGPRSVQAGDMQSAQYWRGYKAPTIIMEHEYQSAWIHYKTHNIQIKVCLKPKTKNRTEPQFPW